MKLVFHWTRLLHLTVIRRIKKDETLDEIPEITSTSTFAREIYFQVWHGSQAAKNKVFELTLQRRLLTYFAAEYVYRTAEIPERADEKVGSTNGVGPRSGLVDLVSSDGIPESAERHDVTRPVDRGKKLTGRAILTTVTLLKLGNTHCQQLTSRVRSTFHDRLVRANVD